MHDMRELVADYGHDVTTVAGAERHLTSVEPSSEGSRIDSPEEYTRRVRRRLRAVGRDELTSLDGAILGAGWCLVGPREWVAGIDDWLAYYNASLPAVHSTPYSGCERRPGSPYYLAPCEVAVARALRIPARWLRALAYQAGYDASLASPLASLRLQARLNGLRSGSAYQRLHMPAPEAGDRRACRRPLAPLTGAQWVRLRRMVRAAGRTSALLLRGRLSAQALEHLGRVSPELQRAVITAQVEREREVEHDPYTSRPLLRSRDLPWAAPTLSTSTLYRALRDLRTPLGRAAWAAGRRQREMCEALGVTPPAHAAQAMLLRGYGPVEVWRQLVDADCQPSPALAHAAIASIPEHWLGLARGHAARDLARALVIHLARLSGARGVSRPIVHAAECCTAAAIYFGGVATEQGDRLAALVAHDDWERLEYQLLHRIRDDASQVAAAIRAAGGWSAHPRRVLRALAEVCRD